MRTQRRWTAFFVLVSLASATGCGRAAVSASPVPAATPQEALPSAPGAELPDDVVAARDAVLGHLSGQYPQDGPQGSLVWVGTNVTPEGLVGAAHFQFVSDEWVAYVVKPVTSPDQVVYHVSVNNPTTGFSWKGMVTSEGQVQEDRPMAPSMQVQGWMGRILGLPAGSEQDDYLQLSPEGSGELGIAGTTPEIETQIAAMRDTEGAGALANFWGEIECAVNDYNGCRLSVSRIRRGATQAGPEPVDGWTGTIIALGAEKGAQFDDAFVLSGDYPVWFGISSYVAESGLLVYKDAIASLRDSGQPVTVWGQLLCGVPDANGCQIQVERLEVDGAAVDPYEGWLAYTSLDYGFTFRYPPEWSLRELPTDFGPQDSGMKPASPSVQLTRGDIMLYIGFRTPDQDYFLGGTGMPAGEFDARGQAYFMGSMLDKQVLVFDGKDKLISYSVFTGPSLVVLVRVDDRRQGDYQQAEIPLEVQDQVDQILGTFELLESG